MVRVQHLSRARIGEEGPGGRWEMEPGVGGTGPDGWEPVPEDISELYNPHFIYISVHSDHSLAVRRV